MMSPRLVWVCVFYGSWLLSCASQPTTFDERLNDASTARQRNDTIGQMRLYDAAFQAAQDENEQAEALYRKARALLKQHAQAQGTAALFRVALEYGRSDRAARAWLDLGRVYAEQRDDARAERCYLELLGRHPGSGSTTAAAQGIAQIRLQRGVPAHVTYADLLSQTTDPGLVPTLLYFEAAALEATDPERALRKFKEFVRSHPLPRNPYSDEAQLRIALLLRAAHQPEQALLHLSQLQKHDRSASFVGSYTRSSYLDSYLLAAQILRDDLERFDEAQHVIGRALKKHAQSAIMDDLYFELALVRERRSLDACGPFSELLAASPRSKYRRCAAQLCPSMAARPKAASADLGTDHCAEWIAHGSPLRTRLRTNQGP